MFKVLIIASLVLAALFILRSTFRRRLIWSIKVTLGIYAAAFALRLLLWPFFGSFEDSPVYTVLAGIALACAAIWLAANWLTGRYMSSRRKERDRSRRRDRPRRSSTRKG